MKTGRILFLKPIVIAFFVLVNRIWQFLPAPVFLYFFDKTNSRETDIENGHINNETTAHKRAASKSIPEWFYESLGMRPKGSFLDRRKE